jgi:hypothetical protein
MYVCLRKVSTLKLWPTDSIHQPLVEYFRLRSTESISANEPQEFCHENAGATQWRGLRFSLAKLSYALRTH